MFRTSNINHNLRCKFMMAQNMIFLDLFGLILTRPDFFGLVQICLDSFGRVWTCSDTIIIANVVVLFTFIHLPEHY